MQLKIRRILCALLLFLAVVASAQEKATRIALIADTHVNFLSEGLKSSCNGNFERLVAAINAANVDLVLIAGDLTENGAGEQMELAHSYITNFAAPVLSIPGNHDIGHAGNGRFAARITAERLKLFEKKVGPLYLEKCIAGVRIVAITSPLIGSGLKEEKAQWKFLKKQLAKPSQQPTLLLKHYPVFFDRLDEPPTNYWTEVPALRQEFVELLKKGGVKAVLSGHMHRFFEFHKDGISFLSNTTSCCTTQPSWMLIEVSRAGELTAELRRAP